MAAQTSAATERALKLVLKGWTPYAAAKKEGIALSTIYRALKREKERKWVRSTRTQAAPSRPKHGIAAITTRAFGRMGSAAT
jgi:transposase